MISMIALLLAVMFALPASAHLVQEVEHHNGRVGDQGIDYVILRRDKTFAEQVTLANTIYEIKYDFELTENVVLPTNIVLKFNGGSINGNYELSGQNTVIDAPIARIFGDLIRFSGTFNTLKLEWFGIMGTNPNNTALFNSIRQRIDFYTIQSFEFNSEITFSQNDIWLPRRMKINGNNNRLIFTSSTGEACFVVTERDILQNIEFLVNSDFTGAVLEHNTAKRDDKYTPSRVKLDNIIIGGTYNTSQDYKLTAIRYICSNNHERGADGYNYITGCHSGTLHIQYVKNGIEMLLDNVDVQGGAYAWMNDFNFLDTFIGCVGTAVKIDNRDSSTQNPAEASGFACFNDLFIQPHFAGNEKLIMLYNTQVEIKNLWPWNAPVVGELRNSTLTVDHMGGSHYANKPIVKEGGETYAFYSGFKVYSPSRLFHNDVFSEPVKWDNYNPVSGSQITRLKGSETGPALAHGINGVPLSIHGITQGAQRETNLSVNSIDSPRLLANIHAKDARLSVHSGGYDIFGNYRAYIANQFLNSSWDGTAQCFAGERNTRQFNLRIRSNTHTSYACNKITYTPYIDSGKTIPLLSKLNFLKVAGVWSTNENRSKVVNVEIVDNSIIVYVENKQLVSDPTIVYFTLEFDNSLNYTKQPSIDNTTIEIADDLTYMPASSTSTVTVEYYTNASSKSRPSAAVVPYIGFEYYDTTLHYPIYWDGKGWRDAAGNVVP